MSPRTFACAEWTESRKVGRQRAVLACWRRVRSDTDTRSKSAYRMISISVPGLRPRHKRKKYSQYPVSLKAIYRPATRCQMPMKTAVHLGDLRATCGGYGDGGSVYLSTHAYDISLFRATNSLRKGSHSISADGTHEKRFMNITHRQRLWLFAFASYFLKFYAHLLASNSSFSHVDKSLYKRIGARLSVCQKM